jgi:hypothetical protein
MIIRKFNSSRISLVVIGFTLLAVNAVVIAAPVSTSLAFTCPFPFIGDQVVIANVSADYPESLVIGSEGVPIELASVTIDAIAIVPDKARYGLDFAGATTVTGVAHSKNTFHTEVGEITHNIDLVIEPTEVPADEAGPFDVPASGVSPVQRFSLSHIGAVTLTIDDLIMDLKNVRADGSVATKPVGEFTVDCALNAGQDNVLTSIQVTTTLSGAGIVVESTLVEFGTYLLGQSSEERVTIRNVGGAILGINAISILGEDTSAFSEANNCTTIAAGETCTITLTYTASSEGAQSARLLITSTDEDEPSVSVPLAGFGAIEDKPEISVAVTSLNFWTLEEGKSTTETIQIENIGTAPLAISGVVVNNSQGSEFSVTENCSSIAAGEMCSEVVTYRAVEGGSVGTVVISSNDENESEITIDLTGSGEVVVTSDPCELEPTLAECDASGGIGDTGGSDGSGGTGDTGGADLIVAAAFDVQGSTYIAANDSAVNLSGVIQNVFNLTQGSFKGDLNLAPTHGSFEIIKGWKRYKATAQIKFEPVGETVGTLVDGLLVATSQAYVTLPKVTKSLFGLVDWRIGGGDECRTKDPVTFAITSAEGGYFDAYSGGEVVGTYTMTALENCGLLTSILSSKVAGSGNTISLSLTPTN